jgi:hypothetical protein
LGPVWPDHYKLVFRLDSDKSAHFQILSTNSKSKSQPIRAQQTFVVGQNAIDVGYDFAGLVGGVVWPAYLDNSETNGNHIDSSINSVVFGFSNLHHVR